MNTFKEIIKNNRTDIVKHLQISYLAAIEQDKIISMFMDVVAHRTNAGVWETLSEKQKRELGKILKAKDKKIIDFINQNAKSFTKIIENVTAKTVQDFRERSQG